MIGVVGLDIHVLASLGSLTASAGGSYDRGSRFEIAMSAPSTIALRYEGDTMTVVASAVLEDHSRVPLREFKGLKLGALRPDSLQLVSNQRIVVPFDPVGFRGPLVSV
jgi:hypothetical protein